MYASAAFLAPSNVKLGNALICYNLLNMFEENHFEWMAIHSEEQMEKNVKTEQHIIPTSTKKRTMKQQLNIQTRSKNYVCMSF